MDLEQFFQENPDWDDGWPNCQQGEEAVDDEDQVGGAQIDITDHIEVTAAGEFKNISSVTRRVPCVTLKNMSFILYFPKYL